MTAEQELAFLKAHLDELSVAFLRQQNRDIVAEKRREAEAPAKARGSGERLTDLSGGHPLGSAVVGGGGRGLNSDRRPRKPANWTPLFAKTCHQATSAWATDRNWVRASNCRG